VKKNSPPAIVGNSQGQIQSLESVITGQSSISRAESAGKASQLLVGQEGELRLSKEELRQLGANSNTPLLAIPTPEGLLLRCADPALTQVYVEPTSLCNLDCRICVRKTWDEPTGFMSMPTYRRLIEGLGQMPSLRRVSFWGIGEPLLHPQIVSMVAMAKELGAETQIITNGLLLDNAKADGLVNAGLDRLIVSVDSVSSESQADVRSGDELAQVCQNLNYFRKIAGAAPIYTCEGTIVPTDRDVATSNIPEIGIAYVLTKSNVQELGELRSLAISLGASFISLTNLLPYTEEMQGEILYSFSGARSNIVERSQWYPEISFPRVDVTPDLFNELPKLLGINNSFGGSHPLSLNKDNYCRFVEEGSIAVNWQGDVSPCIPLMHSYTCYIFERKKRFRSCILGNLGQSDLNEIWNSAEFKRIRDTILRFPFSPCTDCGGCDLSDSNEEDCQGNIFPVCGDCLWAKGVIQCP
jgi:MoaA/NifB/PqqE/SkfB family radical SAM enzyme